LIGEAAEYHDDPKLGKGIELSFEPRPAALSLHRRRFVLRRCATHRRGDEHVLKREAVVHVDRPSLVRESCPVEGSIKPIAGSISSEHPPGSVGSVSCRGEPDHHYGRGRIAEGGYGSTPIFLISKRRSLFPGNALPPRDKARAAAAFGHLLTQ